nr:MAG TPA: hypothetical protein [Caudoviricetes sp.]
MAWVTLVISQFVASISDLKPESSSGVSSIRVSVG